MNYFLIIEVPQKHSLYEIVKEIKIECLDDLSSQTFLLNSKYFSKSYINWVTNKTHEAITKGYDFTDLSFTIETISTENYWVKYRINILNKHIEVSEIMAIDFNPSWSNTKSQNEVLHDFCGKINLHNRKIRVLNEN
jgi:hypothetical protein